MPISRLASNIRKSPKIKAIRQAMFTGWQFKEKILKPVMVNVLTAFLLFITVVAFRDPLYNYFVNPLGTSHWPIFCVLEPEVSSNTDKVTADTDKVTADLFVINLDPKDYLAKDLDALAADQSPQHGPALNPLIDIYLTESALDSEILDILPDDEFNKGKGTVTKQKISATHWQIRLDQIKERALLKFTIPTTVVRHISSRSNYLSLPMTITYAAHR